MRPDSPRKRLDCLRMLAFDKSDFRCRRVQRMKNMADLKFDKEIAALLVIDPYNDFIPE